jgi:outer membrane protein TolC
MAARANRRWLRGKALLLALALAGGCAVGPDFHSPAAPQPERYTSQPLPSGEQSGGLRLIAGQDPPPNWWHGFGSSVIDSLVAQALRANPNMQAAEATLHQALENVAAQRGSYFPSLAAEASVTRNRDATQVLAPTLSSGADLYSLYTRLRPRQTASNTMPPA